MQYRRERALSHYGWQAKSTRGICTKAPRPVKQNFSECGGRIPARMQPNEMYWQGGEENVPASSQSTPNNGGIKHHIRYFERFPISQFNDRSSRVKLIYIFSKSWNSLIIMNMLFIANVTSIGPSSPVCGTSSTEPSRVPSCTMRSRSMQQ